MCVTDVESYLFCGQLTEFFEGVHRVIRFVYDNKGRRWNEAGKNTKIATFDGINFSNLFGKIKYWSKDLSLRTCI